MPMLCKRCGCIHETLTKCPKCGALMHYSLLSGMEEGGDSDSIQTVKYKRESPPGFSTRFLQCLFGMVVTQILCYVMALGLLTSLNRQGIDVAGFEASFPGWFVAAKYGIPLLAIAMAVYITARGVYLAQLVGLTVGVLGAAAFLGERMLLPELVPHWYEWLVLPPLGGAVGFLCGVVITGQLLVVRQETEYKKIDTWDRDAKAGFQEIEPSINTRWKHIFFGVLVGQVSGAIFRFTLKILFSGLYPGKTLEILLESLRLPTDLLGVLVGGIVAGAGTKSGVLQGLFAGIGIYMIWFVRNPSVDFEQIGLHLLEYLPICVLGGVLGHKIFGPGRVYHGTNDSR